MLFVFFTCLVFFFLGGLFLFAGLSYLGIFDKYDFEEDEKEWFEKTQENMESDLNKKKDDK